MTDRVHRAGGHPFQPLVEGSSPSTLIFDLAAVGEGLVFYSAHDLVPAGYESNRKPVEQQRLESDSQADTDRSAQELSFYKFTYTVNENLFLTKQYSQSTKKEINTWRSFPLTQN
ncbi:MAG TPA: hypothetical protein VLM83_01190 [Anaerolineales bacterium]|nr:hypothetical protein [Anaerolineales bacterium]